MPSLRRKVSYGYYAVVALLLGLSVFVVVELRLLERRIVAGEALAEFFDATLEIRRFEKNYFLYAQGEDLNESMRYAGRARELLDRHGAAFAAFVPGPLLATLRDRLPRYESLMRRYAAAPAAAPERKDLEQEVRRAGKEIVTHAEEISGSERRSLQGLLARYRRGLVGAIVLLSALAIAIGQVLVREVGRPLRALEQALNSVAEGRYEPVAIGSRDREIVSLTNALNRMLRERELHERHLIQSEKLASLGTLLSGVAHELNNPLSNISTSAQILAEEMGAGGGLAGELVGQIGEQTDRARNIVRSLLEFSRDREFRKEPLPLRPLVEETVRFLKGQIPPGVTVEVAVPPEVTLPGDRQRLQQVFLNLVKNAVEAVPPGAGRVVVSARRVRPGPAPETDAALVVHANGGLPGGDVIEIEVRDNGPGIPPEIRKKIFDPFFTTKDVGKGSGLGLFVVYEIIDEHDGGIAVGEAPGGGTLFTIRLPA